VTTVSACTACPLHVGGSPVPSLRAPASGGLVVMLEQPSPREFATGTLDRRGLDLALEAAALDAATVSAMFWVKCRATGGRLADAPFAIEACHRHRNPELDALRPSAVVLMGGQLVKDYFGAAASVGRVRGKPLPPGKHGDYAVVATWHHWAAKQDRRQTNELLADLALAGSLAQRGKDRT
jgi:uracil-DNA glycosylase family 4